MLLGLDIGGTTLKSVKLDEDGTIVSSRIEPAGGRLPREAFLKHIRTAVAELTGGAKPERIGIAVGGAIQPDGTMLATSTNLPNLAGLPLVQSFSDLLDARCRVDNDARAAMRGESWIGAAAGLCHAMVLTLGSGIGSGLLSGGRIVEGAGGKAGEIGLWRLAPCGTLEDIAAPVRFAVREGQAFGTLFSGWRTGDGSAIDRAIDIIGQAIVNAHLLLDLDAAILLGGVTEIGEPLRRAVEQAFLRNCPEDFRSSMSVRLGALGQFAGAVGAASLWRGAEE